MAQTARALKDIDFADLREDLEKIRYVTGTSLYEHLTKVFEVIILHKPERALERFEEISFLIKTKDAEGIKKFLATEDIRCYSALA